MLTLFDGEPDMPFYDVTSSYFEGDRSSFGFGSWQHLLTDSVLKGYICALGSGGPGGWPAPCEELAQGHDPVAPNPELVQDQGQSLHGSFPVVRPIRKTVVHGQDATRPQSRADFGRDLGRRKRPIVPGEKGEPDQGQVLLPEGPAEKGIEKPKRLSVVLRRDPSSSPEFFLCCRDFAAGRCRSQKRHPEQVAIAVVSDFVPPGQDLPDEIGMPFHPPAETEETRLGAVTVQNAEHPGREIRVRAVVQGKGDDFFAGFRAHKDRCEKPRVLKTTCEGHKRKDQKRNPGRAYRKLPEKKRSCQRECDQGDR